MLLACPLQRKCLIVVDLLYAFLLQFARVAHYVLSLPLRTCLTARAAKIALSRSASTRGDFEKHMTSCRHVSGSLARRRRSAFFCSRLTKDTLSRLRTAAWQNTQNSCAKNAFHVLEDSVPHTKHFFRSFPRQDDARAPRVEPTASSDEAHTSESEPAPPCAPPADDAFDITKRWVEPISHASELGH